MNTALFDKITKECIHLYPFKVNGDYFLFDTESLKVASIPQDIYNIISSIIKNPVSLKNSTLNESYFEEIYNFAKSRPVSLLKDTSCVLDRCGKFSDLKTLRDLTLIVCEACNLKCEYCYLRDKLDKKTFMDRETCRRAIDLFYQHADKYVHINFYGGEPLLNFDIIKYATEYAVKTAGGYGISPSFGFVTNGTICNDEILNHLTKYKFLISISLDGPAEIHNRFRKFKSGELTFDVIMKNIENYFSHYGNKEIIRFAPTIFYDNYNQLETIYDFFVELERKYGISFNAFSDIQYVIGKTLFSSNKANGFCTMLLEYGKLIWKEAKNEGKVDKLFTKVRIPPHFFKSIFRNKIATSKCGAGISAMVVYPDGTITGCKQFDSATVRGLDLSWGNVFKNEFNDELRLLPLKPTHTALPKACKSCFIKNICTSMCPGLAYYANGNFAEPDQRMCEVQKTFCKLSIWLVAKALKNRFSITNELLDYRITFGLRPSKDESSC